MLQLISWTLQPRYLKQVRKTSLVLPTQLTFDSDWNLVTIEQAIAVGQDPKMAMFTYAAAKARGEKALWDFAEQHPDLNVTTSESHLFIFM